jgi:hypothetical protein
MSDKVMNELDSEWTVEWATPKPHAKGVLDTLVLSREQSSEYGDELVQSLRVDEEILRQWGLDPKEPLAWTIKDGKIVTKQISRQLFERVADSERDDAYYARETLKYRAERCIRRSSSHR